MGRGLINSCRWFWVVWLLFFVFLLFVSDLNKSRRHVAENLSSSFTKLKQPFLYGRFLLKFNKFFPVVCIAYLGSQSLP